MIVSKEARSAGYNPRIGQRGENLNQRERSVVEAAVKYCESGQDAEAYMELCSAIMELRRYEIARLVKSVGRIK